MKQLFVIPTIHPAFIARGNRRWMGVVQHDLLRAKALARGWRPSWTDSKFIFKPSALQVAQFCRRARGKRVMVDIETDGEHPLRCQIRCIGLFDGEVGICIPIVYRDGSFEMVTPSGKKKAKKVSNWVPFYDLEELAAIKASLQGLLSHAPTRIEGQNYQFDRLCMRARLGLETPEYWDLMVAHHVVSSFLPHGLDFLASLYTDICYYKKTDEGHAWSTKSDEELWLYCLRDTKAQWIAAATVRGELSEHRQNEIIYEHDYWQVKLCERWKEVGIGVDLEALELLRIHFKERRDKALESMRQVVGATMDAVLTPDFFEWLKKADPDDEANTATFNPGSLRQLRKVLHVLGVPLSILTATSEISTAKEYLLEARKGLIEAGATKDDRRLAFLDFLFAWRENAKIFSTYLQPDLIPGPGGMPRIHPTFSVHVTPTGRLASKNPNGQNQPKVVRCMYVAREGHVLVAGDWDSLELRLVALISGEQTLIKAFKAFDSGKGPKVHKLNASAIFQIPIEKVDPDGPIYRAAKVFAYAVNYGAGPQTVFDKVREEMPDMQWKHFLACYENFKSARPQLFAFQKELVASGVRNRYLESPILRRREYFFEPVYGENIDTPEASAMLNFPCQAGGADVVGLANRRIDDRVVPKYRKKLKRGEVCEQLAQVHDELLFELPERLAEAFKADFKKVAEEPPDREHAHWHLPVEIKVSKRWAKLPTFDRQAA